MKTITRILTLLLVFFVMYCDGRRRRNHPKARAAGCDSHPLTFEDEPCSETNCRFGGICRQVTNFRTRDATLRLIVPSHVKPLDLPFLGDGRRHHRRGSSVPENPFLEAADRPTECVCALDCRRERARAGPVCGTNGRTYDDECDLKEEACRCQTEILVAFRGPCEKSTATTALLDTFADDETLTTSGDQVSDSSGEGDTDCEKLCSFGAVCDPDSEDEPCKCVIECKAQSIAYVCGTDGRTYTSECQMKQSQCRHQIRIDLLHDGPCTVDERRVRPLQHGGHRHGISHEASASGYSTIEASAEEVEDDPCQTLNCDGAVDDPLCGTDTISYPNECVMRVAACMKERPIEVKYRGFCQEHFEVPTTNVPSLVPVRLDTVFEGDIPVTPDPCREIYCLHNAVCVEHEVYEFVCSCDDMCKGEVPGVPVHAEADDKSVRLLSAFLPSPSVFKADIGVREMPSLVNELHKKKIKQDEAPPQRRRDSTPEVVVIDFTGDPDLEEAWSNEVTTPANSGRRRGSRRRRHRNSRHLRERGDYRVRRRLSKRDVSQTRPLIEEVVCGTDGKTYQNECEMMQEACHKKARISVAHRGACPIRVKEEQEEAPSTLLPVLPTLPPVITPSASEGRPDSIDASKGLVQLDDAGVGNEQGEKEDGEVEKEVNEDVNKGKRKNKRGKKRGKNGKGKKRGRNGGKKKRFDASELLEEENKDDERSSGERPRKQKQSTASHTRTFATEMSLGDVETREEEVNENYVEDLGFKPSGKMLDPWDRNSAEPGSPVESPAITEDNKDTRGKEDTAEENDFPLTPLQMRDEIEPESEFESLWESNIPPDGGNAPTGEHGASIRNDTVNNFTEESKKPPSESPPVGSSVDSYHANPWHTKLTWGIAIGIVALIAVVAGVWAYMWRRRRAKEVATPDESAQETDDTDASQPT